MALGPYLGGSGRGGGGGGPHVLLHKLMIYGVGLALLAGFVEGGGLEGLAHGVNGVSGHVIAAVRIVAGGLAVIAVMVGGLIAVHPRHRMFGYDVALGGVIVLVVSAFGPTIVSDVQHFLPASAEVLPSALELVRL